MTFMASAAARPPSRMSVARLGQPGAFADHGLVERQITRDSRNRPVSGSAEILGVCAEPLRRQAEHPLAGLERGRAVPQGVNHPHETPAQGLHLRAQKPCHRPREERVRPKRGCVRSPDCRRVNAHSDLAGGRLRERHTGARQHLGRAITVEHRRRHRRQTVHDTRIPARRQTAKRHCRRSWRRSVGRFF